MSEKETNKSSRRRNKEHKKYTRRQQEVLALLLQQYTNEQIAEMLHISIRTIEGHRRKIMKKIGAKSFAELVAYYHKDLEKKLIGRDKILNYTYTNIYQMFLLSNQTLSEVGNGHTMQKTQSLPSKLQKAS